MNKEELLEKYKKYAEENGLKISEKKELVDRLLEGLLKNQEEKGESYCPCRRLSGNIEEDKDKICPCKWSNEEIDQHGMCLCGLFVKG